MVIVEDDLLFSPDFLEYLETNAPVLERDPTTLVLSAWNDNGYAGRVSEAASSELRMAEGFGVTGAYASTASEWVSVSEAAS